MRFLFYSHDGLGLGHTRRNLAVAAALTELEPQAAVLIATGVQPITYLGVPRNVGILKLPGIQKLDNEAYAGRDLPISLTDHLVVRSAVLRAAVESFRPDVLLADKHPFGVGDELVPALEVVRGSGGRTVLGLRDILDDRETVLEEWGRRNFPNRVPMYFDRVLVYGERSIFDPIDEYEFPPLLADKTFFCGYVLNRTRREWRATDALPELPFDRPTVLATAGGGKDGVQLLRCFLNAASGAGWNAIVVSGPETSERDRKALGAHAREAGAMFRSFQPGLSEWFERVDALVSMGGYNTIVEALATGTPTVCVPRVVPRFEQLLRARTFERLGLLQVLEPDRLNPLGLRREIEAALSCSRKDLKQRARAAVDFDGAHSAARHLIRLAARTNATVGRRAASIVPGVA